MRDITPVDSVPSASVDALNNGTLDGAVVWNPYAYQIRQQLAEQAVLLRVQSSQSAYAVAVAQNDWLAIHREVIVRSIRAIAQAKQYLLNHPSEARAIVQKRMNYDDASMDTVLSENVFSLSLDQSLITAMEDKARWMINSNLTTEKRIPNLLDYIYEDGLKAVKPEAVTIIR